MSFLAKSVFAASCVVAFGTVGYVHWKQVLDRHFLHEGILREQERQERKIENLHTLQTQIEITKRYKAVMEEKHKDKDN